MEDQNQPPLNEEEKEENFSDDYADMEKIDIPSFEKKKGNESYYKGDCEKAAKHYSKALLGLHYLIKDNLINDQEKMESMIKEIEIPCNLNLAQCYLKLNDNKLCIHHSTKVLEIEGDNIKALYRRAQANIKLGEIDLAVKDLKKAQTLDPQNTQVNELLQTALAKKQKLKEKYKLLGEKMIDSLDYTDKYVEEPGKKSSSVFKKLISGHYVKKAASSIFYHVRMAMILPFGLVSERCCKRRIPSSVFSK